MIGRLRGVLAEVGEAECLIDCGGVGYVASCGARTLGRLPAPGDETTLYIHSQWSEDAGPRLYGFLTRDERRTFTVLLAIQGVGPKLALRIVTELKGKALGDGHFAPSAPGVHAEVAPPPPSVTGEAVAALLGLGIAEVNARRAVDQALIRLEAKSGGDEAELPAVIRAALQELGR